MSRIALCLILGAAAVSSVHVYDPHLQLVPGGFPVPPQASGYIYRSDNDGPASLIQLGAHRYNQPQAFAPPLPLASQPIFTNIEASQPIIGHVASVAQILPQPIVLAEAVEEDDSEVEDDDESGDGDESGEDYEGDINDVAEVNFGKGDLGHYGHHGHEFEQGGGSGYNDEHHSNHGGKGSKGYSSHHHNDKGASGQHANEGHKGFYQEGAGENGSHFNEADKYGASHEAEKGHKGEDFGHKESHSKGEKTDGFHKVYHKDEYKKNTDFYDESDNSGHFKKHGYYHNKHGSAAGGHKKGGKQHSGHDQHAFGKKGHHAKGHHRDADQGYSAEDGGESYHHRQEDYADKGGHSNSKDYGFED